MGLHLLLFDLANVSDCFISRNLELLVVEISKCLMESLLHLLNSSVPLLTLRSLSSLLEGFHALLELLGADTGSLENGVVHETHAHLNGLRVLREDLVVGFDALLLEDLTTVCFLLLA